MMAGFKAMIVRMMTKKTQNENTPEMIMRLSIRTMVKVLVALMVIVIVMLVLVPSRCKQQSW